MAKKATESRGGKRSKRRSQVKDLPAKKAGAVKGEAMHMAPGTQDGMKN